jgi:hypothetical protein
MLQTAVLERPNPRDMLGFEIPFMLAKVGCIEVVPTIVLPTHILHCDYQLRSGL